MKTSLLDILRDIVATMARGEEDRNWNEWREEMSNKIDALETHWKSENHESNK